MTTKQCIALTKSGTQCKRMTHFGDYCDSHNRIKDESEKQEREIDEGHYLLVSERNKSFINWLLSRPEYDFMDENAVIDWLIRNALGHSTYTQTPELFNLMYDIWTVESR